MYRKFLTSSRCNIVYELTAKTLLLRNEGTYLGFLWYLIQPLLEFAILLTVFHHRFGMLVPLYPLYLIIGIVHWQLLGFGVQRCIGVIAQNARYIKTLPLDRSLFVYSGLLVAATMFVVEMLLIVGVMLYYNASFAAIWLYPFIILIQLLFEAGIGFACASLYVFMRDIQNIWSVLQRAWWFLTPVFYPADFLSADSLQLVRLNPM